MKITFKIDKAIKEYNGYIEKNNNKFSVKLEVPQSEYLPDIIVNMKGFYDGVGTITMMNNQKITVSEHRDIPELSIYTYESNYVIYGEINEELFLIKTMSVYYKENDYFFIKDKFDIDYDSSTYQFQLSQDRVIDLLLENKDIIIKYYRHGGLKKNDCGEKIFITPAYINVIFKKQITINDFFEHLRNLECVLGFVFNKKMNLIELSVLSNDDKCYTVVPQFQKEFKNIKVSSTPIVDLTSLQLLKDTLNKYYSDKHVAASINMFYEYIYNDLDNIFEFTSLVNTIELICASKKYKKCIDDYTLKNSKKLLNNNKKMNEILELLSPEQEKFIKNFYNFKKVELRDKIKYIFEEVFNLQKGDNVDKYISSMINTRNYFVHGTKYPNLLNFVNLVVTKKLLRQILYLLIIYACSKEKNLLIDVYEEMIPIVYNNLVSNYN